MVAPKKPDPDPTGTPEDDGLSWRDDRDGYPPHPIEPEDPPGETDDRE